VPLLVMVAGPNGSGKSTLIATLRSDQVVGLHLPAEYVNADDLQRQHRLEDHAAQRMAADLRARALSERRDLMCETVMSHPSKLAELQRARAAGYEVHLHFVATDDPAINLARVALRVAAGGHGVPPERVVQRYARTLALAPSAIALADQAYVYDNSVPALGLELQAQLAGNNVIAFDGTSPRPWVNALIEAVNERADELERLVESHGGPLSLASLDAGETAGVVVRAGRHYALQRLAQGVGVVHELALLPPGALAVDRLCRVAYSQGVGSVQSAR
jgi:predicted ABC-type ATPase